MQMLGLCQDGHHIIVLPEAEVKVLQTKLNYDMVFEENKCASSVLLWLSDLGSHIMT